MILRVRQYRWYVKIPGYTYPDGVTHPTVVRTSAWSVDPPKDPPKGAIVEYRDAPWFVEHRFHVGDDLTITAGVNALDGLAEVAVTGLDDAPGCGEAATDPAP